MKSKLDKIAKVLSSLEKTFHFFGMWQPPDVECPVVRMQEDWDEDAVRVAKLFNLLVRIRSLPTVARLYGPVPDTLADEFLHDYATLDERTEFLEHQLARLLEELKILQGLDLPEYEVED